MTNREHLHSVRIGSTVTPESPEVVSRLAALTDMLLMKGLDPATAGRTALKILNNSVSQQSFLLAYGDAFYVIGAILAGSSLLLLFVQKPRQLRKATGGG